MRPRMRIGRSRRRDGFARRGNGNFGAPATARKTEGSGKNPVESGARGSRLRVQDEGVGWSGLEKVPACLLRLPL